MNREKREENGRPEEDAVLIRDFQKDCEEAFDRLVLKYQNKIFNLCYQFLGNHEDADDCAQESFIKVFRNLKGFQFRSSFSTWLYRIAVNTCKNKVNSLEYRLRRKTLDLDRPREKENGTAFIQVADERHSPVESYEKKELREQIQKAIQSLPEKQRGIVVMRDLEGLSYGEIGRITKLKAGTVKSKLARAREELRKKLKGAV